MGKRKSLRDKILNLLQSNGASFNKSEVAKNLAVHSSERAEMRRSLAALEREGLIEKGRRGRYQSSSSSSEEETDLYTGAIRMFPGGHGVIYLETEVAETLGYKTIHIPARKTSTALHGDTVSVKILSFPKKQRPERVSKKRRPKPQPVQRDEPIGTIIEIVNRGTKNLVGTLEKKNGNFYVEPDSANLPPYIELSDIGEARRGQKVVLELEKWTKPELAPLARVVRVLGWADDPGVDILGIIHRHNLATDFPEEVQAEADQVPETIPEEEISARYDCRKLPIITIDPHDARDHDDAVWVEKLKDGWQLHVHIADVSHYVKPDTALDREAISRGNSTYLVDRVIPMLPTALSNGICSLVPDEDRLTKLALITFDQDAKLTKATFHSAVIRSQARLSYEDAQDILDGKSDGGKMGVHVKEAWALASKLREKRFQNGALDLDFPEYRIQINKEGKADGYKMNEHTASHKLIEEFMLVANEAVALALKNKNKPTIYRAHEDPDAEKLNDFGEQAKILGFSHGDLTQKEHLQALIKEIRGSEVEQTLKLGLLKSLKRATYSPEPLGHYGLAKVNYCHFTSPIRRYADLIVHRSLQGILQNPPAKPDRTPKQSECAEIAQHISVTERTSSEAEMDSKKLKLLEWLDQVSREENPPTFSALVTDARPMGLFIELQETMLRGVVKPADLLGGYWRFDNDKKKFFLNKKKQLGLADSLMVKVKKVDFERQRVDFAPVEEE